MNKLRLILFLILLFTQKANADNYVDDISGISSLAESTVKAAVSQMNSDTSKVLESLNTEIQNLSSPNQTIEAALDVSITEAKKL